MITSAHVYWSYLFISKYNLGVEGAAYPFTVSYSIRAVLTFLYISVFKPCRKLFFFLKGSFSGLWTLFKIVVPIGSMIYLEWIAFEIMTLFSSTYTPQQIAAQIAFTNITL